MWRATTAVDALLLPEYVLTGVPLAFYREDKCNRIKGIGFSTYVSAQSAVGHIHTIRACRTSWKIVDHTHFTPGVRITKIPTALFFHAFRRYTAYLPIHAYDLNPCYYCYLMETLDVTHSGSLSCLCGCAPRSFCPYVIILSSRRKMESDENVQRNASSEVHYTELWTIRTFWT